MRGLGWVFGVTLAWASSGCVTAASEPTDGSEGGSTGTSPSDPTTTDDDASASMSSTSAATNTDDESSSGGSPGSVTSMETSMDESSTSSDDAGTSSGDSSSESTGEAECNAETDPNVCFMLGCVYDAYTENVGCRPPFGDAECGAFVDSSACVSAFCDWDVTSQTCGADEDDDCAAIVEPIECFYRQCYVHEDVCYELGALPCGEVTGIIDCLKNLCTYDDRISACV